MKASYVVFCCFICVGISLDSSNKQFMSVYETDVGTEWMLWKFDFLSLDLCIKLNCCSTWCEFDFIGFEWKFEELLDLNLSVSEDRLYEFGDFVGVMLLTLSIY